MVGSQRDAPTANKPTTYYYLLLLTTTYYYFSLSLSQLDGAQFG